MKVKENSSKNQLNTNKNSPAMDRLSEDGGRRAGSKSSNSRKSRRRKPRSATNESKTRSNVYLDNKKELSSKSAEFSYHQSYPSASNSAPHIQSQGNNNHVTLRPRSLYTVHSYHPVPENNFQRFNDYTKYLEVSPSDQWPGTDNETSYLSPGAIWRQRNLKTPIINSYYGNSEEKGIYSDCWREQDSENLSVGAVATPYGTISLRLHNRIRVDMTVDRAIRVINFKNNIVLSLSGSGSASALLHPNGRIYQYGSRVEILAHDSNGNHKYAKMWYKGISFTSEQCALVYLVDAAGTRTTTDSFSDMSQNFSLSVFYSESRHGPSYVQEATSALSSAQYWLTDEGIENWIINNVRISQTPDGLVRIARNSNKYQLRTSPTNGTASLTTPFLRCTASLGQTSHLFVRRGERRMHYDGTSFIVRNAGHSAGFDDNNQLKVY
ncbi:uncharacterized protein fest [Chelonus insularis]|uniref:uncharacterized protein fest n=1 Tax=Chelonus insularis TaxID=460826 RepID=UPI00158E8A32|nr:uncharacterized protein LOC118073605 [Chelonus insularis]